MSRLLAIQTETVTTTKELREAVQTKLGITPDMTRVLTEKERVPENDFDGVRKPGVSGGENAEIINVTAKEFEEA